MRSFTGTVAAALLLLSTTACLRGNGLPETREFDVLGARGLAHRAFIPLDVRRGPTASLAITCDENLLDEFRVTVSDGRLTIDTDGASIHPQVDCRGQLEMNALESLVNSGSGRVEVQDGFPSTSDVRVEGSGKLVIRSTLNSVDRIMIRGSGTLSLVGAATCDLAVESYGSGRLEVGRLDGSEAGCAARLALTGSGGVFIGGLAVSRVSVRVDGSGSAEVAGKAAALEVRGKGSGRVTARNLPVERADVGIHGSGSVEAQVSRYLRLHITGSGDALIGGDPPLRDLDITGSGRLRPR